MSAAFIAMAPSRFFPAPVVSISGLLGVAGEEEKRADHIAGNCPQYRRNNIKI
jgi:hypothetical protein